MKLELISDIPTSVNHYLAYRVAKRGDRHIAFSYKTKEALTYQREFTEYVKREAKKQKWSIEDLGDRHVYFDTLFYFPRTNMDCNNYFKVMLDAITDAKVVWKDDDIVCERVSGILYDAKNPRIEIVVTPVKYIGIFEDADVLATYKEQCENCSRYNRNCSVFKKALEGRIQDGVTPQKCDYFRAKKK